MEPQAVAQPTVLFPDYALGKSSLMIKHTVRITTFARDVGIQHEHHLSEAMRGGKGRKSCKGWKGGYIDATKNYWTAPAKPDEAWSKGFMSEQVAQKLLAAGSAARQRFDTLIAICPAGVPLTADTLSGGMNFQLPVSQSMVPSDKSIDVVKYTPWLRKRVVVLTGKYKGKGATVIALCKMKIKLRVDGVEHELEYYPDKIQPPTDLDEIAAGPQPIRGYIARTMTRTMTTQLAEFLENEAVEPSILAEALAQRNASEDPTGHTKLMIRRLTTGDSIADVDMEQLPPDEIDRLLSTARETVWSPKTE